MNERMRERLEVFTDADRRGRLTDDELKTCPTIEEILEARAV